MLPSLVAALALGFVKGPAEGGKDVTEMRQKNRWLIVGTWERQKPDGTVVAWTFRRNGEQTVTLTFRNGDTWTGVGTYRIDTERSELDFNEGADHWQLVRLDRRVLVWRQSGQRTTEQFRRR